jgi:hypothetical protein
MTPEEAAEAAEAARRAKIERDVEIALRQRKIDALKVSLGWRHTTIMRVSGWTRLVEFSSRQLPWV